jgi:hypothetical protein
MGQEDYRRLDNVEDKTHQGRRNLLKFHSTFQFKTLSEVIKRTNLLYASKDRRAFWYKETTIDIILHQSMGKSQGKHGAPTFSHEFKSTIKEK